MAKKNKGHANVIGKGFKERPENINRKGRPKMTVNLLLDEIKKESDGVSITKEDIKALYLALLDRTQEELTTHVNDTKLAMVVRIIAKAMLDKRGFDIIERMLDRSIGRPANLVGEDPENRFGTLADAMLKARENMIKAQKKNESS